MALAPSGFSLNRVLPFTRLRIEFSLGDAVRVKGEAIISADDKLEVVQQLDPRWHSLRDRVCCTRCGRIFTVAEIAVLGGSRAFGPVRLHCPNNQCAATSAEWTHCELSDGHIPAADITVAHNGRVCFVRWRKRLHNQNTARRSRFLPTLLGRLEADWAGLRRRLSRRAVVAAVAPSNEHVL